MQVKDFIALCTLLYDIMLKWAMTVLCMLPFLICSFRHSWKLSCIKLLYRYMGATLQQEFWDCVIIYSEFKLWRNYGKTNNSILCSGFECICCMVLQGMGTFDSFQSALRFASMYICALCSSSFQHTTV